MIVRIQGEGQFELDDGGRAELEQLDAKLFQAINSGDEASYTEALQAVAKLVQDKGSSVPDDQLVTSDIILPSSDTTLAEAKALLTDEGYLEAVEA